MIDTYFLGHFDDFRKEKSNGSIRVLSSLRKRTSDGAWIVGERTEVERLFPPRGKVFWPEVPESQASLLDQLVRFKVEEGQNWQSDPDRRDQYFVARESMSGKRRVSPIGSLLLPLEHVDNNTRTVAQSIRLAPPIAAYTGEDAWYEYISGPWKLEKSIENSGRLYLKPKHGQYVIKWRSDRLPNEMLFSWDEKDRFGGTKERHALLFEPNEAEGEPIDLLTSSELVNWLVKLLKHEGTLLHQIDETFKGWRKSLGERLETFSEAVPRKLNEQRWGRLQFALDSLVEQENHLTVLLELPQFRRLVRIRCLLFSLSWLYRVVPIAVK